MGKIKENFLKTCIYGSALITVSILLIIVGFIFSKGYKHLSFNFLYRNYDAKTTYIQVQLSDENATSSDTNLLGAIGVSVEKNSKNELTVAGISKTSVLNEAVTLQGEKYVVKKSDLITKIDDMDIEKDTTVAQINDYLKSVSGNRIKIKVVKQGGGIFPMIVSTVYLILLTLFIIVPIGVFAALYLTEYAKKGKILTMINIAIQNLAGIPSIIYGLFGTLFFVQMLKLGYSILAGALTISIMLFPVIMETTKQALLAMPNSYREASIGLGATKLQTCMKVVLPNSISGILTGIILSIGRIIGESAALLLTAGTVAAIPSRLYGNSAAGATLTVKAYMLMKEESNIEMACAIGIILLVVSFVLNIASKKIGRLFEKEN